MKVYFDVGANNGWWGKEILQRDQESKVYFFEPTPNLTDRLEWELAGNARAVLVKKAVSDVPGKAKFNLSPQSNPVGHLPGGCSSLLDFKSDDDIEKRWPGRLDIRKADEIEVDCVRMDDFCREHGITQVDEFHCDVQGMDLRVLQSFGDLISIVKHGQIEAAESTDSAIYKDQDATSDKCQVWLSANGFKIDAVQSNDDQRNEVNIFFSRS